MTKEYFKILPKEVFGLAKLLLAKILSYMTHSHHLWLISERGCDARDNGYIFFLWLKEHHPDLNVHYIITPDSQDYYKLKKYETDIVFYNSFAHYLMLFQAEYLISTHICGYRPDIVIFSEIENKFNFLRNSKKVFLQHGIIKGDLKALYSKNVHLDLFICGAKTEYEYVLNHFGYKDGIVKYTGLCRYDNLSDFKKKKQILIMPTWRMYIEPTHFDSSCYFKTYKSLLLNKELINIAKEYGYSIVFYPHYEVQKYINLFKALNHSEIITIADQQFDVQTLLKESSLLITDYSSVFFDFAYMNKPILFYQFDKSDFQSHHYASGYFDESIFGDVVKTEDVLIKHLSGILSMVVICCRVIYRT